MNETFEPTEHPHRRFNPLINEWVLVSPHRAKRPWQGQVEEADTETKPVYDPECYLCPGNERISGDVNDKYTDPFVFKNDFSALTNDTPAYSDDHPLFKIQSAEGESRVICFSPDHSRSLPLLSEPEIVKVIECWMAQCDELGSQFKWVQVFENKGSVMGCSNPHPHGQIWAQNQLPSIVNKKQIAQLDYLFLNGTNLLQDYVELELTKKDRIVEDNSDWIVVVPFWAAWPFETLLLPKFKVQRITELDNSQAESLAEIIKKITTRYDNLFKCSFPYSMGWHGAPFDSEAHPEWTLHASFFPPLLRSAEVRKFMVGYEMLAEPQRDITPEQAAARLRELPVTHYSKAN